MPIWEIVNCTVEDFQEVFSEQWLGKIGRNEYPPFHLFEKRNIGRVYFITVKKTSEFSEYGSDMNMPSGDGNNLAYREKYPVVLNMRSNLTLLYDRKSHSLKRQKVVM